MYYLGTRSSIVLVLMMVLGLPPHSRLPRHNHIVGAGLAPSIVTLLIAALVHCQVTLTWCAAAHCVTAGIERAAATSDIAVTFPALCPSDPEREQLCVIATL